MVDVAVYILVALLSGFIFLNSGSGTPDTSTLIDNINPHYDDWQSRNNEQKHHENETYYDEEYPLD